MRSVLLVFSFILSCFAVAWSQSSDCSIVSRNGADASNCENGGTSWLWNNRSPSGCSKNTCPSSYGYCCELIECNSSQTVWAKCRSQCQLDSLKCEAPNVWDSDSCKCVGQCSQGSIDNYQYQYTQCINRGGDPSGLIWKDFPECTVEGECLHCNDHTNAQTKCTETWNPGYSYDADGNPGGGGYWQITTFDCYYDSCAMSLNCTEKSKFPAGSLTCDDFESPNDTLQCIAAIGSNCTIQCPGGTTINCKCDGSCLVAQTRKDCQCPQQSSSSSPPESSSSLSDENSSSSDEQNLSSSNNQDNSSSSFEVPRSSSSPRDTSSNGDWEYDYSQVLNEIETNTRRTASHTSQIAFNTNEIATNTNVSAGYLSSIDKWQSTINFNLQAESGKIQSAIESGAAQAADATKALGDSIGRLGDSLGRTNSLLDDIKGTLSDSVPDVDISGWQDSANAIISKLENPETTLVRVDSLENDTSRFKSSYSRFFLSGAYSRDGCYEFKMAKPSQDSKFGRFFKNDIVVDFGNLAGTFDFCAILRGIVRIAGALLVILISIKSYRSAFSSEDG